jgi:hypothetical protein
VHPDHYTYFSPVTLRHLMDSAGFSEVDIHLYSTGAQTQRAPGITKDGIIAVGRVELG